LEVLIFPINRRNFFEVRSISVEEMDSHLIGTKIDIGVLPVSIIVEENSKCFMSITEMNNSRNVLIQLENNFDYFSRDSFASASEIVC